MNGTRAEELAGRAAPRDGGGAARRRHRARLPRARARAARRRASRPCSCSRRCRSSSFRRRTPTLEYVAPLGVGGRPSDGKLDLGAYEYGTPTPVPDGGVDASTSDDGGSVTADGGTVEGLVVVDRDVAQGDVVRAGGEPEASTPAIATAKSAIPRALRCMPMPTSRARAARPILSVTRRAQPQPKLR